MPTVNSVLPKFSPRIVSFISLNYDLFGACWSFINLFNFTKLLAIKFRWNARKRAELCLLALCPGFYCLGSSSKWHHQWSYVRLHLCANQGSAIIPLCFMSMIDMDILYTIHMQVFSTILLFFYTFPPPSTCTLSHRVCHTPQTEEAWHFMWQLVSQHNLLRTEYESRQDASRGSGCGTYLQCPELFGMCAWAKLCWAAWMKKQQQA